MTLLFFMQKNRDDAVQLGHKTRIKKDLDIKRQYFTFYIYVGHILIFPIQMIIIQ